MNSETKAFHLDDTVQALNANDEIYIIYHNHWAAVALESFDHKNQVEFEFNLEGKIMKMPVSWSSDFEKSTYANKNDLATNGAVGISNFVMAILLNYKFLLRSETGDGVDYRFLKSVPDELNFFNESHYVEVSGLLEEKGTNTVVNRFKIKHKQIDAGKKKGEPSSVIITLFSKPSTSKEIHI